MLKIRKLAVFPASAPLCSSSHSTEGTWTNSLVDTVYIDGRRLSVKGNRIENERSVYYMSHHAFTLDRLYSLGGKQSWWCTLLDLLRISLPG